MVIFIIAMHYDVVGVEAGEHEQGGVLGAQMTTTNQSITEIDVVTASHSKLQTDKNSITLKS